MMYGKGEVQEELVKGPERKESIKVVENDCGKITIQVNLSKEGLHNTEICQIIRELFQLSNCDIQVEKLMLTTGEETWQMSKMEKEEDNNLSQPVTAPLADKRRKTSRLKLAKYNRICKIRLPRRQARQGISRKLSEKLSGQFAEFDLSEVHSSPAITNLLSQLYPNPYNLISLLEVRGQSGCKAAVDSSDSCKIKFKAKDISYKESEGEQEFSVFSIPKVESAHADGTEGKNTDAARKDSPLVNDLLKFSRSNKPENTTKDKSRNVKKTVTPPGEAPARGVSIDSKQSQGDTVDSNPCDDEMQERTKSDVTINNRKRTKPSESKMTKKKVLKAESPTTEKARGDKPKRNIKSPSGETASISTIHPMSLQKTNLTTEKKPVNAKDLKSGMKPMTAKKKCIMQYLKLIKDLYEAEERCLQSKMDDAWNFAIDQLEKPGGGPPTRKHQQPVTGKLQYRSFKHSQSQTPKRLSTGMKRPSSQPMKHPSSPPMKRPSSPVQKSAASDTNETQDIHRKKTEPTEERKTVMDNKPEPTILESAQRKIDHNRLLLLRSPYKTSPEPTSSWLESSIHSGTDFGGCNKKPSRILMDTFVFRRKIPKSAGGFPVDVINRNIIETSRKIDLLISHIDNSMDWLTQSERTESSNISSLIEKAKDLSERLEKNLRTEKPTLLPLPESSEESWRLYENKNLSCNRSDLLLAPTYQSLHFFPIDRSMGSVRIRGTFFNEDLSSGRIWLPPSLSNLMLPHSRSVNYLTSGRRTGDFVIPRRGVENRRVESEVPELRTSTEPLLILVENRNELGSFAEEVHRREHHETRKAVGVRDRSVGSIYRLDTLAISVTVFDDCSSATRPVIVQETTWSFPVPGPSPVTRAHYRNERHMVFTTMEASVLHVSITTSFMNLVLMSVAQVVEQEPRQQSSVIISLHKCSSFVKNYDAHLDSGDIAKIDNSSADVKKRNGEVPESDIKVLKQARKGRCEWNYFRSESSMEMYDGDRTAESKLNVITRTDMDRFGNTLMWVPDPYESNPADEGTETADAKQTNFHAVTSCPQQASKELFANDWVNGKQQFDGSAPPIFRYLSSETSNTSLDEKEGNATMDVRKKADHSRKVPMFAGSNDPPFPKMSNATGDATEQQEEKHENDDSSSTSSFKSSNDFSDVSELPELSYPKKKPISRSHFLDKLFHELRSFRKCLTRRRGLKRKGALDETNEFEDALSDLDMDMQQEDKVLEEDEKQTMDEAVAVNSMCIDELGSHAMPRKIFKTSFRGKESVTELMIDLKDVSISEVRDISVEKRKLSTDHTKISIIISKQGDENGLCCANQGCRKGERGLPREVSCNSIADAEKAKCLGWKRDGSKSDDDDDDDDDYKSAHSGPQTRSLENIPGMTLEEDSGKMLVRDTLMEPRRRSKTFGRHKFDFYKKMENTTSYDSVKLNGNDLLFGKYDKGIAPLKKALADMQFRVHNIQKNTFCTSDEYYERALKMAKMSAGYCRSCKSKTVIPEDPLGIYQKLIPRSSLRSPYNRHRKYYFKTTSSTNSSFYSIHSSNSDISDKFCHLNSSSSIFTNGLGRSRGPGLTESSNSDFPLFLGRTIHF